jgi:hypothetical protein
MLNFLAMAPRFSGIFIGIVLVVGMIVVSASVLFGEERPHPSLVDPAITKCTVCHTSLGAAHTEGASNEDCLTCHTFLMRSRKTFLIVEQRQQAEELDDLQRGDRPGIEGAQRGASDTSVPRDAGAARSDPPAVESVAVPAGDHASSAAAALPPTSPPARQDPTLASGDAASTGQIYAEGLAAFNRSDFDHAFNTWRAMLNGSPDHYALQVEVDSLFVSAQSTVARYGDHSLFVVKKDDLYWVFSGLFTTQEIAIEALKLLPGPLRQGGAFPIKVSEIMSRH